MVNHTNPLPTEWFRIKGWLIERYVTTNEVWCNGPQGKTFIIKLSTYEFPNIPFFVQKTLRKSTFLDNWRHHQIDKSVKRLQNAILLYRRFMEHTQPIPDNFEKPFFS